MRAVVLIITGLILACNANLKQKKVVCYFNNWSIYRPGKGAIDILDIDPKLCSHLIYNIAGITDDANLISTDPYADLYPNGKDGYRRFNKLQVSNYKLKTLIAVGGFSEGSSRFSRIAADDQLRQKFVTNAVAFVKKHGFNGLDLAWSYPSYNDGQNFVKLLKQLKKSFTENGLILSAMLKGLMGRDAWYDVPEVLQYLDFANIIAFDLHGPWDRVTGINSPLYPGHWEEGWARDLNVDSIVRNWISQGAPADKLVLSIATYGRSFTLDSIMEKGIGAAARLGRPGPYTRSPGMLGYNEICEDRLHNYWNYTYDGEQHAPFIVRGDQWVGYDDTTSILEKVMYIHKMNLGGAFVYTLDTDDFKGVCGIKYPLLKALL